MAGWPNWMQICYTDDGCYSFVCLNCEKDWEARTRPGWRSKKVWKYCPYCGCEWEGELKTPNEYD